MKRRALPPAIAAQVAAHDARRAAHQGPREMVLPYPPSANAYWRSIVMRSGNRCHSCGQLPFASARVLLSQEARDYTARVERLFPKIPVLGALKVTAHAYRPRRIGDLGNVEKVLSDALQGIAYDDDAQIVESHWYRHDDKNAPRVEVRVEPI